MAQKVPFSYPASRLHPRTHEEQRSVAACEKRLFPQLFLCLSRARLGKMIVFMSKLLPKKTFSAPVRRRNRSATTGITTPDRFATVFATEKRIAVSGPPTSW